jgi:hypothetical protein
MRTLRYYTVGFPFLVLFTAVICYQDPRVRRYFWGSPLWLLVAAVPFGHLLYCLAGHQTRKQKDRERDGSN